MTYDIVQIMKMIPHRFPFLLIDRIDEVNRPVKDNGNRAGWSVRATKNVSFNEPYFVGHFPHRPVMPGVLQIESMAQAAAISVLDLSGPRMDVAIAGVSEAKFRKPVVPGDTLDIYAEVTRDRGQILLVSCNARVKGVVVAEAELMAKMFLLQETV